MDIGTEVYFVEDLNHFKVVKTKVNGVQTGLNNEDGQQEVRYQPYQRSTYNKYFPAEQFFLNRKDAEKYLLDKNPLPKIELIDWTKEKE